MKHLNVIKYYCYPNLKATKDIYINMDEETENFLLEAAAEFIVNVRLKYNHPFDKWSNHEKVWDFFLKNSL